MIFRYIYFNIFYEYLCISQVCLVFMGIRRRHWFIVTDDCEPPCRCRDQNQVSLQEGCPYFTVALILWFIDALYKHGTRSYHLLSFSFLFIQGPSSQNTTGVRDLVQLREHLPFWRSTLLYLTLVIAQTMGKLCPEHLVLTSYTRYCKLKYHKVKTTVESLQKKKMAL